MKTTLQTLLFAAGLLAVATVTHAPVTPYQGDANLRAQCCDPLPLCPPFCDPPPPPEEGLAR